MLVRASEIIAVRRGLLTRRDCSETSDGEPVSEQAGQTASDYKTAYASAHTFRSEADRLYDFSIYLSRLVDKHDSMNSISYDIEHPIWRAFLELCQNHRQAIDIVAKLEALLNPFIDSDTGEVVQSDPTVFAEQDLEKLPAAEPLGGLLFRGHSTDPTQITEK